MMENIKCSDSDIPPEARENLYAEWTKFRDWLEADGMTGCIASYRAGYIAAWEHQAAELDALRREVEAGKVAVRYALATFRALGRYTFEDSDHGLLIAEAVKKLEDTEFAALEGESR